MKVKLNIPDCEASVTDERPGTPRHPKLVVNGVYFWRHGLHRGKVVIVR